AEVQGLDLFSDPTEGHRIVELKVFSSHQSALSLPGKILQLRRLGRPLAIFGRATNGTDGPIAIVHDKITREYLIHMVPMFFRRPALVLDGSPKIATGCFLLVALPLIDPPDGWCISSRQCVD